MFQALTFPNDWITFIITNVFLGAIIGLCVDYITEQYKRDSTKKQILTCVSSIICIALLYADISFALHKLGFTGIHTSINIYPVAYILGTFIVNVILIRFFREPKGRDRMDDILTAMLLLGFSVVTCPFILFMLFVDYVVLPKPTPQKSPGFKDWDA